MTQEKPARISSPGPGETGRHSSASARERRANVATIPFHEARRIILTSLQPLDHEVILLMDAWGRVLAEDIISDVMLPPLDDSALDGYAVLAEDTRGASPHSPVSLMIAGEMQAGASPAGKKVSRGTAIRIMTGAPIPEGADSIIRFEDTTEEAGYVRLFRETRKHESYRFAGENIRQGETILFRGDRLKSADIGLLASLNLTAVRVFRQPKVSIISTGDELAELGETCEPGQIRNINAYTLYAEVRKCACLPHYLGLAKDTSDDTRRIFSNALKSDVVISTGGVSAGKYDFVREILSELGITMLFERVNVKPGTPCAFGVKDNTLIFALPGNPVPVLTSFLQFVRPALLRLMGAKKIEKPIVDAILENDIQSGKAHHLVRGYFTVKDRNFYVSATDNQKPSMLRSMSEANCLIIIPENISAATAGEKVAIQLIEHDEI